MGHVTAGCLAAKKGFEVNLLTGHPDDWTSEVMVYLPDGETVKGRMNRISSDPKEVVSDADYVILCLPGFLIADTLTRIAPFLKSGAIVGSVVSSNGFFWMAKAILPADNPYFGMQRVPFIATVQEYGKIAALKGYRKLLKVAVSENANKNRIRRDFEAFFDTPVEILGSFWAAALTNSNPLLHTARSYALFKNDVQDTVYPEELLFYETWNDESATLLIACDEEFQQTIRRLPFDAAEIPSLLEYYESHDAASLACKLRSIPAFKGIRLRMKKVKGGFVPDCEGRYFREDIPFGLLIVKDFAHYLKVHVPFIDKILYWAQDQMGKEYLVDGELKGKDVAESGISRNFGVSIPELIGQ